VDEGAARHLRDGNRPATGPVAGPGPRPGGGWREEVAFLRRTLIVAGVVVLLLFLWTIRGALLLAFAAVLVAVLIRAVADPLRDRLRLSPGIAVPVACLLIGVPLALALILVGAEMQAQLLLLLENLPEAAAALEREFGIRIPVPGTDGPPAPSDASAVGAVARQAASVALVAVDSLAALAIVVAGGIYFAADPGLYRRGIARLLPRAQQQRARDALDATGRALRLWLLAQLTAMAVVGTLTGLGAWAIGLPAPLALGLFAGLVNIVPLIGPFIGALPGVLLAFNMGLEMLAWTLALYLVVQQIEGNVLLPLLGQRMVSIPSALLLFAVVAAGAALGLGGVLLAAPLTVLVVVLVGKLYVRETLGQRVAVPGEEE
jgi:predicted PurR-regulated permease PerM